MGRNMGPRMRLLPESEKKMTSPPSQAASCAFTLLLTLFATAFANARAPLDFSIRATKPPTVAIITIVWGLLSVARSTNR